MQCQILLHVLSGNETIFGPKLLSVLSFNVKCLDMDPHSLSLVDISHCPLSGVKLALPADISAQSGHVDC